MEKVMAGNFPGALRPTLLVKELFERLEKEYPNTELPRDTITDKLAWGLFCLEQLFKEYAISCEYPASVEVPFGLQRNDQRNTAFYDGLSEYHAPHKILNADTPHMHPYTRHWMTTGKMVFRQNVHVLSMEVTQTMTKVVKSALDGVSDINAEDVVSYQKEIISSPELVILVDQLECPLIRFHRRGQHPGSFSTQGPILRTLETENVDADTEMVIRKARFLEQINDYAEVMTGKYAEAVSWVFTASAGKPFDYKEAKALFGRAAEYVIWRDNEPEARQLGLNHPVYKLVEQFVTSLQNRDGKKEFCPVQFHNRTHFSATAELVSTYTLKDKERISILVSNLPQGFRERVCRALEASSKITGLVVNQRVYSTLLNSISDN